MKALFHTDRFGFKLLNALALNALVFNICIPSLSAMNHPEIHQVLFSRTKPVLDQKQEAFSQQKTVEKKSGLRKHSLKIMSAAAAGPGQAESASFSINSNDNILNKFTGDMSYTIPLMDIDGYPINISYNPNVSMDQEASWVGLGWDLAFGSISREMRGIPDDFNGDLIERTYKVKPEEVKGKIKENEQNPDAHKDGVAVVFGTGTGIGVQLGGDPGFGGLNFTTGFQYLQGQYVNSYTGIGHTKDLSFHFNVSFAGKKFGGNYGLSNDDQNGIGISKGLSVGFTPFSIGLASLSGAKGMTWSYNSREGIVSKTTTNSISGNLQAGLFALNLSSAYGSTVSYGKQTYIPKYNFISKEDGDSRTTSAGLTVTAGGLFVNTRYVHENYNNSTRVIMQNNLNGYGYFHYAESENDTHAMLDFNRESKNEPSAAAEHLNFSQPTFDLFYCNAPGISTNFRAHRYDVYKLHDPKIVNTSLTENTTVGPGLFGGQTPLGYPVGATLDLGAATVDVNSSTEEAISDAYFPFADKNESFNKKEYYLKTVGENTFGNNAGSTSLYDDFSREKPARLQLMEYGNDIMMSGNLITENTGFAIPGNTIDMQRKDNIIHYREYSAQELEERNMDMYSFPLLTTESTDLHVNTGTEVDRTTTSKKAHHIQAVEAVNESGARYFFGIPNYSYAEKNVNFSVKPTDITLAKEHGICQYAAADRTTDNAKGRQEMYDCQTMPAYAHSFLLTEVYSNDYTDLTGNGPSKDDIGNYYKLNYTNAYGEGQESGKFSWRAPLSTGTDVSDPVLEKRNRQAYFIENLETDPWDDMAYYSYGEKDLWYGQSIESKNVVAFFKLEARKDMYAVSEDLGNQNISKAAYLLKKIELYSKNDLEINGENAIPLQVVEFEYDYSLCQDYPGNYAFVTGSTPENDGKLTLKGIYSYTGKSKEMKTVPYIFEYAANNPAFKFNSSDRWGNYKPNDTDFPNHAFPYAEQDESTAAFNITAWKLKTVHLPEGGELEFEYAPDSYAYVQNKRAMRMFSIEGVTGLTELENLNDDPFTGSMESQTFNYLRDPEDKKDPHEVVYFKLAESITAANWSAAGEILKDQYFTAANGTEIDKVIVNLYADLGNKGYGNSSDKYEYVQSVAPIEKDNGSIRVGVVGDTGPWEYGFMILEKEGINENSDSYEVTSLQLANWQFARKSTPYLIYGEPDYAASSARDFCDYSTQLDGSVVYGFDLSKRINKKRYGLYFNREKSQVRLYEPDNKKLGGGARIVSVTYRNNWDAVSGEAGSVYKWEYNYDSESGSNGVAAYEPQIGAVENPLYELTGYNLEREHVPDEKKYHFAPICDMMYPAPVVGYSRIESFFSPDIIAPERSVGKNVEKYYTSKDFPLKFNYYSNNTLAMVNKTEGEAIIDELNRETIELLGLSEGFTVETNDMHGKIRSLELFDAHDNLISSQEYIYADPYSQSISYLRENGNIEKSYPPREIDMYADSWQNVSTSAISQQNMSASIGVLIIPLPIPITPPFLLLPIVDLSSGPYHADYKRIVKAYTFTKAIHHTSVLTRVQSNTMGSSNTAENLIYDYRSGQVLLSSLKDEFNDPLYSFSYPAHWKHRSFLNMNKMDGFIFTTTVSGSKIFSGLSAYRFTEGDYFKITETDEDVVYAWALNVDLNEKGTTLIDADGLAIDVSGMENATVEVLRTGRKNRMAESMMAVRTKRNPYEGTSQLKLAMPGDFEKDLKDILDVSAVIYSDKSQVPCPALNGVKSVAYQADPEIDDHFTEDQKVNPFLIGAKGNYQVVNSLAYQSTRKSVDDNDVRQDGEIDLYEPFYSYYTTTGQPSGNEFSIWFPITHDHNPYHLAGSYKKWRILGKIDGYDEQHNPIQVSNQVKVPSSHLKSLNEKQFIVQEASAVNAKYNEIGFDGFEFTAEGDPVLDNSFNLNEMLSAAELVTEARHSGNYSLKVATTGSAVFKVKDEEMICSSYPNIVEDEYYIRNCDCIPNFEQEAGKTYFFSVWVKETTQQASYANTAVRITFSNTDDIDFIPSGPIIEGWQKIEGEYTIPAGVTSLQFDFINSSAGVSYFDDFRTHPLLAAMQSVVYDSKTLLPLASHDAYNFTTFYNYDNNHQLVRVKVETIEGIHTISEQEQGTYRIGN